MNKKVKLKSKVVVSFVISHFACDPSEISALLKVKPTKVRQKGILYQPMRIKSKFNLWMLETSLIDEFDAEIQVLAILKLMKRFPLVKDKVTKFYHGISCVVYFKDKDTRPILSFSSKTIKALAKFDCDLDIDYYFV